MVYEATVGPHCSDDLYGWQWAAPATFPTPKERMAMTRDLQQALKQEADADEPE